MGYARRMSPAWKPVGRALLVAPVGTIRLKCTIRDTMRGTAATGAKAPVSRRTTHSRVRRAAVTESAYRLSVDELAVPLPGGLVTFSVLRSYCGAVSTLGAYAIPDAQLLRS